MPNKPFATVLAFAPRTPAGRQRAIAAVGGLAAAVLVVVGVTSGGQAPGSGHRSEALAGAAQRGNPTLPPADSPPSGVGVKTGVPGLLAADRGRSARGATSAANAVPGVHGSFSVFNGAATNDGVVGGEWVAIWWHVGRTFVAVDTIHFRAESRDTIDEQCRRRGFDNNPTNKRSRARRGADY